MTPELADDLSLLVPRIRLGEFADNWTMVVQVFAEIAVVHLHPRVRGSDTLCGVRPGWDEATWLVGWPSDSEGEPAMVCTACLLRLHKATAHLRVGP